MWIKRDGQDHFYREQVVLPALLKEIHKERQDFRTLVDFGSGDGHVTNLFLEGLRDQERNMESVLLLDQSSVQLQIAKALPSLKDAQTLQKDLIDDDWVTAVLDTPAPRIFLSVFVFQEIPVLETLIERISRAAASTDICLAVFVAPSYSDALRKHEAIRVIEQGGSSTDWEWAGMYPISVDSAVIFLPHFQRSLQVYQEIAAKHGLIMAEPKYLSVPDTPKAREVFGRTIYGQGIVGAESSVLISLGKDT
jgi:hypothetical protein